MHTQCHLPYPANYRGSSAQILCRGRLIVIQYHVKLVCGLRTLSHGSTATCDFVCDPYVPQMYKEPAYTGA